MLAQQRQARDPGAGARGRRGPGQRARRRVRRLRHDDPPRPGGARRPRACWPRCTAARPRRRAGSTDEPGFAAKSIRQRAEKAAIAARAAELVAPGTAIALSAGTTTAELAQRLVDVPGADRGDQLDPGRRHLLPRRPAGPDRRAHRRRPHAVRRAGRPGRGRRDPVAARRRCCSSACTA